MEDLQPLKVLEPEQLLAIYADKTTNTGYYIERHRVRNGKVLEGSPLTKGMLNKLVKAVRSTNERSFSNGFTGLIPSHVLHYSHKGEHINLMWVVPSQKIQLFFSDGLGIQDGLASIPALLFFEKGNELCVFALKTERVTADTALFVAPFHNTSAKGEVCLGTAKRPKKDIAVEERMKGWENTFFNSRFSHANGDIAKVLKTNINQLWSDLIKSGNSFPLDILTPNKKTVSSLLERL